MEAVLNAKSDAEAQILFDIANNAMPDNTIGHSVPVSYLDGMNRPGFLGDLTFWENIRMKNTYSPEIRQRAVRLYQEQRSEYPTQWAATVSIASKFGCTPETLRTWIKKFEADLADNGAAADQAQRIKQLERDNKELQRANEILRKAAAFFAQAELDRK